MPSGRVIRPQELQRWGYNDYRGALGQIGQVDWRRAFRSWVLRQTENAGRRAMENLQDWFWNHQRSREHRFRIVEQLRQERRENDNLGANVRTVTDDGQNNGESITTFNPKNNMPIRGNVRQTFGGKIKATKKAKGLKYFKDVYETGGTCTADNVAFLGHATNSLQRMYTQMNLALARAFFGKVLNTQPQTITEALGIKGTLYMQYRAHATDTTANTQNFSVATTDTLVSIAAGIEGMIDSIYSITTTVTPLPDYDRAGQSQAIVDRIYFLAQDSAGHTVEWKMKYDLHTSYCHLKSYSVMTIQNQSQAKTADDAVLEVDAVPLVGKIYAGPGGYPLPRYTVTTTAAPTVTVAIQLTGAMLGISSSSGNTYGEPPPGKTWINVKKESGIKLEPGEMKVSKLYNSLTLNYSKFYRKYAQLITGVQNTSYSWQKFQFVALEKALGLKPDTNVLNVKIGYQIQQEFESYAVMKNPQVPILQRYTRENDYSV